jgi:hypothetical protein
MTRVFTYIIWFVFSIPWWFSRSFFYNIKYGKIIWIIIGVILFGLSERISKILPSLKKIIIAEKYIYIKNFNKILNEGFYCILTIASFSIKDNRLQGILYDSNRTIQVINFDKDSFYSMGLSYEQNYLLFAFITANSKRKIINIEFGSINEYLKTNKSKKESLYIVETMKLFKDILGDDKIIMI